MTVFTKVAQTGSRADNLETADRISQEVTRLFDSTFSLIERDRAVALDMIHKATRMLELVSDKEGGNGSSRDQETKGGLAPWQAIRIERYIESRIDQKLMTEELAQVVKLSASYFSAAFKVSFGMAPHAYVITRRIEAAKEMLSDTTRPISEIALECGFADQAHLSRLFRRSTGVPPRMWRRLNDSRFDRLVGPDFATPASEAISPR